MPRSLKKESLSNRLKDRPVLPALTCHVTLDSGTPSSHRVWRDRREAHSKSTQGPASDTSGSPTYRVRVWGTWLAKKKTVSDEVNHNLNNYFKPEVGTDGLSLEVAPGGLFPRRKE